jgi:RimJ/RimL family protein N-acetyltransferase
MGGRGLATEAAGAATRFEIEAAGLERIMAVVLPENVASRRVLENLGFVHEGNARYYDLEVAYSAVSRDRFPPDGSFYSVRLSGDS